MSLGHGASIVRSGLVLHLDAANVKSYPGTGTTWTDLSGNGNNATLVNSPTYSTTNKGSMLFDGSNDYISLPSAVTSTLNTSTWSYMGIISTNTNSVAGAFLGPKGLDKGRCSISVVWTSAGTISFANEMVATVANTSVSLNNGELLFICYTYGSGNINTYKNGVLVGGPSSYTFTGDCLGPYSLSGPGPATVWNGSINTFSLYNRTLSATEIYQNFEALRGRYGI